MSKTEWNRKYLDALNFKTFGNRLKFTLTDDQNFYKKVILEDKLDVDLDDECKYKK